MRFYQGSQEQLEIFGKFVVKLSEKEIKHVHRSLRLTRSLVNIPCNFDEDFSVASSPVAVFSGSKFLLIYLLSQESANKESERHRE